MTAPRITVFSQITDPVLSCVRDRVQLPYKMLVSSLAEIPQKLPAGMVRVDLAGHKAADGLLSFGAEVVGRAGASDPFVGVLTAMKQHGVQEVNLLGCTIDKDSAADKQIRSLAQAADLPVRGTKTPLNVFHYGHAGLLPGVEGDVFDDPPPRTDGPRFTVADWLAAHPAPPTGRAVDMGFVTQLSQHLSTDYLTCCPQDP